LLEYSPELHAPNATCMESEGKIESSESSSVLVRCVKLVPAEVFCRREQYHALTVSCIDCGRAQTKTDIVSASFFCSAEF
jgi:hypothetical protein